MQNKRQRQYVLANLSAYIKETVSKCWVCNDNKNNNQREPLLPHALPGRPWEKIGTDIFNHKGFALLLCVDYFKKYPEIRKLIKSFARHRIPDVVVFDNGPQYASAEFAILTEKWDFKHITLIPDYVQSNGQTERTVQTVKNLLNKSQSNNSDAYVALREYHSTPRRDRLVSCTAVDGATSQDKVANIICTASIQCHERSAKKAQRMTKKAKVLL